MASEENLTPFGAMNLHAVTKEGADVLVVCVMGRFELPVPGRFSREPLRPSKEQNPPILEDVYWGEPGFSSLRYEGQGVYYRPGTDIYLNGHARALGGKPVKEMLVRLRVGPCQKEVLVLGDRKWRWNGLILRPSLPKPFVTMPLFYERSFGGITMKEGVLKAWEPRNPIGTGFYTSAKEALGQPLPNLEDPKNRIKHVKNRPAPAGFGAICRGWQPRIAFGGTYDDTWLQERAPLWPVDFDLRFFSAAASGLFISPHLEGGEPVVIEGVSQEGNISFLLPKRRFLVECEFKVHVERKRLILDTVLLEPDLDTVVLIWRTSIVAHRQLHQIQYCEVRELEPWEP